MKAIAILLLAGVFLRHDTAFLIASWTGWPAWVVFRVSGVLFEVYLLGILLTFVWTARPGLWRELGIVACGIGMVEALMVVGCRAIIVPGMPPSITQCDLRTGLPVGLIVMCIELIVLAVVGARWLRR